MFLEESVDSFLQLALHNIVWVYHKKWIILIVSIFVLHHQRQ